MPSFGDAFQKVRDPTWLRLHFKRVAEGWIFRSPINWAFGLRPSRRYLITEAQKAEIEEALPFAKHLVIVLLAGIPYLLLLALSLTYLLLLPLGDFLLTFFVSWIPAAACGVTIQDFLYWRVLRSKLVDTPRASQRITLAEQVDIIAASSRSAIGILVIAAASLLLVAVPLHDLLHLRSPISSALSVVC